jgi:thymidylate kinase
MEATALKLPPLVVAVEGIDASGKTSLCEALVADLRDAGRTARGFRFYGWDFVSDVLGNYDRSGQRTAEAASAAYAFGFATSVHEAQQCGAEVAVFDRHKVSAALHDRFFGIDAAVVQANAAAVPDPDLLFYVAVPPAVALARRRAQREPSFWELPDAHAVGAAFVAARARCARLPGPERAAAFLAQRERESQLFERLLHDVPAVRRLDGTQPPAVLRQTVRDDVLAALDRRGAR